MFIVQENDKDAVLPNSEYSHWHNCKFSTYDEAVEYAKDWLGMYYDLGMKFEIGIPVEFHGKDAYITIKEIKE